MRKRFFAGIAVTVLSFLLACSGGDQQSKVKGVSTELSTSLKTRLPADVVKNFEDLITDLKGDPASIRVLALYAYLNRNPELAAWLYSVAAEKQPDDMANISNLGTTLVEIHLAKAKDPTLLEKGIELLRAASKNNPAAANNLGYALLRKFQENRDAALLSEAEKLFKSVLESEPDNPTATSHLAEVLKEQGKTDEAAKLLNKVHLTAPFNGVFNDVAGDLGDAYKSLPRTYCDNINFHCDEKCPHSIIGRLQYVTCEMEQSSQIMNCRDGEPYFTEYNCDEEMGDVPFLIPGLNSGVCIPLPYVKLCIMLQGGGKVDYKVEFQVPLTKAGGINVKVEGSYEPSSGQSTVRFKTDAEVNLVNSGKVAPELNKRGMGPVNVTVAVDGRPTNAPLEVKTYDAVIWN
ncbi:MAG TPA: tetratricopeptide repeat protein [Chitinophagaceae bacterium]|nr:tetratricopeptide repeat protein [Chitinophagaceae bacterium]